MNQIGNLDQMIIGDIIAQAPLLII